MLLRLPQNRRQHLLKEYGKNYLFVMEIIRKQICVDKYRSHKDGILPFVIYNSEGNKIHKTDEEASNFGQYVCDFLITEANGHIKHRLRYLDLIRKYNFIQERLRNGIIVTPLKKSKTDITSLSCSEFKIKCNSCGYESDSGLSELKTVHGYSCPRCGSSDLSFSGANIETSFEKLWKEEIYPSCLLSHCIYLDKTLFTQVYDGVWGCADDSEIPTVEDGDCGILVEDYNTIQQYEEEWKTWWELTADDDWRKTIFNDNKGTEGYPINAAFCQDMDKYIIGQVEVPYKYEGNKVPKYIYHSTKGEYLSWFERNKKRKEDKSVVKEWEERGGDEFYEYLKNLSMDYSFTEVKYGSGIHVDIVPPQLSMDILIDCEPDYSGVYYPYEYSLGADGKTIYEVLGKSIDACTTEDLKWHTGWGEMPTEAPMAVSTGLNGKVESKLETLYSSQATYVTDSILGIYKEFDDTGKGQLYKCTYSEGKWEEEEVDDSEITCGDGEIISASTNKYQSITILSCFESMVLDEPKDGDYWYFLVRFKNDKDNPMDIPFIAGVPIDKEEYGNGDIVYNMITKISPKVDENGKTDENKITIDYIIGAISGSTEEERDNGIKRAITYTETLPYTASCEEMVSIDGMYPSSLFYNKIDMESSKVFVRSLDYNIERKARLATLVSMEVNSALRSGTSEMRYLITKDGTEGLMEEPSYDINITFDRGSAAAWENHFKLGECCSIEDLENYGNNFFNMEEN